MNVITEMITQQISGTAVRTISQRLGLSEAATQRAIGIAVPLIIAALARNAAQPAGAENLQQAVAKDHDGSIFDDLLGYVNNPQAGNGAGILGHVFGQQQGSIQNNLAQATGIDQGSAGGILEMVAPMVMGAVGQTQRQNELDPDGLSALLNGQQQQAQAASPDVMGMLGKMLDSNQDGSATDDVGRMLGNFFK